jgi:nucleotide-binding universal stress UspA family protein|tara:strand:- start:97 stop:525 length:429 start_codon:yes stop_codon:yes gene_type:complete
VFKSILVPVDVAHRSSWEHALPQALELAAAAKGTVTIMTVIRDMKIMFEGVYFTFQVEQMLEGAQSKLSAIISEQAKDGVKITSEVRIGSIGREILSVAKDRTIDLILMASHRPEMRDYLIGPNASFVAQHADCSVLVLRHQ